MEFETPAIVKQQQGVAAAAPQMNDTTPDGVIMCDRCPEERAVARYQWSWGESGYCSLKGQFLLDQQAKNLKQHISYLPLVQQIAEPLKRDERVRLIAEKLSAESERDEVLERNSRLYAQNTELGQEVNRLKLRDAEAGRQISDLNVDVSELREALAKEVKTSAKLADELQKANVLLEAGPGEEAAELDALRKQVETANARIGEQEKALDAYAAESSELRTKLGDAINGLLQNEALEESERALLETELRKLKEPSVVE